MKLKEENNPVHRIVQYAFSRDKEGPEGSLLKRMDVYHIVLSMGSLIRSWAISKLIIDLTNVDSVSLGANQLLMCTKEYILAHSGEIVFIDPKNVFKESKEE